MLKALVCIKPCKILIQDTVMLLKAITTDNLAILSYTNQNFLQTNIKSLCQTPKDNENCNYHQNQLKTFKASLKISPLSGREAKVSITRRSVKGNLVQRQYR